MAAIGGRVLSTSRQVDRPKPIVLTCQSECSGSAIKTFSLHTNMHDAHPAVSIDTQQPASSVEERSET